MKNPYYLEHKYEHGECTNINLNHLTFSAFLVNPIK